MSNYPKMTLSGIAQTMQINLMREVPQTMMILGQSGVGKTQWFRFVLPKLVAEAKGVAVDKVAVILTQPSSRDATEFAGVGIPSKNNEGQLVTRFSLPNLIERIESINEDLALPALPNQVCTADCDGINVAPRIIEERVAYIINNILGDAIRKGTGTKAMSL